MRWAESGGQGAKTVLHDHIVENKVDTSLQMNEQYRSSKPWSWCRFRRKILFSQLFGSTCMILKKHKQCDYLSPKANTVGNKTSLSPKDDVTQNRHWTKSNRRVETTFPLAGKSTLTSTFLHFVTTTERLLVKRDRRAQSGNVPRTLKHT